MSMTYEQTTTTTQSSRPAGVINMDTNFWRTIPGILKIVEFVLDLIVIICTSIVFWSYHGGGWVYFVSVSAIISTTIIFLFYCFGIYNRMHTVWYIIVLIYYIVFTVFFLIGGIVAAVQATIYPPAVGATAFFCFLAAVVYGVDAFMQFQNFRIVKSGSSTTTTSGTTTVTTASTTYEQRPQY